MVQKMVEHLKSYEILMSSLLINERYLSGLTKSQVAEKACLNLADLESAELTPASVPCKHLHSIALVYGFEFSQALNQTMAKALGRQS